MTGARSIVPRKIKMKISYATPHASPSYTTLGDENDRSALFELFAPSFQPLNQIAPLAGGANTFKAVRGNVNVSLEISVTIPYDTQLLALAGIATLRAAFTVAKHLKVEHSSTVHYYPHAHLNSYQPVLRGKTIQHNFSFTTHDLTTSAPTT
jgi:hypothetical protein